MLLQALQAAEEAIEQMNPDFLAQQKEWWVSFVFGPTPQRPHESYDVLLSIAGMPRWLDSMYCTHQN